MFWRIFYGFLRFTGLHACFAGGYPCCCTMIGSTSSKPPPSSTSTARATITCRGCSIGSHTNQAARDLLVEVSGITNRSCSLCEELNGTYVVPFQGSTSSGTTLVSFSCSWLLETDTVDCGFGGQFRNIGVGFFGVLNTGTNQFNTAAVRIEFYKAIDGGTVAPTLTLLLDETSGWFDVQDLRDCVNWVSVPLHGYLDDGNFDCRTTTTPAIGLITAI